MAKAPHYPMLEFTNPPIIVAGEAELATIQLAEGFRLPKSYCDFAGECGYGLLCNLFIVYIPLDNPDSLVERHAVLTQMIKQGINDQLFEYEPHGSPELAARLIPFGISENGHTLAWNPLEPTGPDEYMIYVLGSRLLAVNRGAPNLYHFVEQCLDDRVKPMLGLGYDPLPATFKPFPVPSG